MSIWFANPTIEQLNQTHINTMPSHLDMQVIEIGDDYLKAKMPVDHRTIQPYGILHGGASVALAETLGSTGAFLSVDPSKKVPVGLEINANHVRSVRTGYVIGTAKPIHRGSSTHIWEINIHDEQERLVCISRLTLAILDKR